MGNMLSTLSPGFISLPITCIAKSQLLHSARHEFLLAAGISFAEMYQAGITPVVARIQIAFKTPLRSRDEFVSKLRVRKEGLRYIFMQDIFRLPDHKLVVRGQVDTVCLVHGKLSECPELGEKLQPYYDPQ